MKLPLGYADYQAAFDDLAPELQRAILQAVKQSEDAMNFLIGQVMRQTQGRADPHLVRQMLRERLDAAPIEAST
jgi:Asp-tRNA(Asn)/Glu-tRNA(Gln) amidotransferase B subunit